MKTPSTFLGAVAAWSLAAAAVSAQAPDAPPSRVTTPDAEFVQGTAADVLAEIEVGRLATRKATRPEVREFGQMMMDAQGRAYEELKALAAQKKFTLPIEPKAENKAEIAQLDLLSGRAFDDAVMKAMTNAEMRALGLFTKEAGSWGDPDVKAWAEKSLPTLKEHVAKARRLSGLAATTTGAERWAWTHAYSA